MTTVEEAFQKAVDRALCRVSREPIDGMKAEGSVRAAQRINGALAQLGGLQGPRQPNYGDPDVALFYAQWYLPQQINVTYSGSTRILSEFALPSADELQIVDFGAGTGAMSIGLSLAIATQVDREDWPELIAVYHIDYPSMLDLGRAIWCRIRDEVNSERCLLGLAEVMDRTLFECAPLDKNRDYEKPPQWRKATRWLTAIHVVYENDMPKINSEMASLCDRLEPLVEMRTAISSKRRHLASCLDAGAEARRIDLCMDGSALCTRRLRMATLAELRQDLGEHDWAKLSARPDCCLHFLNGEVRWKDDKMRTPFAVTVGPTEVEQHG